MSADARPPTPGDFSVVAIVAAYNEEDVIGLVVGDLIAQGVSVYLLDHRSTDGTVAEVEPYLGRGLLRVERFPDEGAGLPPDATRFALEAIMRRKEALARELPASWLINHDADEFRESPWPGVGLRDAIAQVDALGYNAIDFELLNFWPTHDSFRRGDDPRRVFPFYERGQPWDKLQIRCWKRLGGPVDLASSGGHEARFPGRRVFPLRFLLRHYPIRSQAHGERKVFRERRPRFAEAERARGWHVHYEGLEEGHRFIRDPATLVAYDPGAVRLGLALRHRGVEELEDALAASRRALDDAQHEVKRLSAELTASRHESAELRATTEARGRTLDALRQDVARLRGEARALTGRLAELHASRSWRWTAPLRAAQRLLRGR